MSPSWFTIPRLISTCMISIYGSFQHIQDIPKPFLSSSPSKKMCWASEPLFPTQIFSYNGRNAGSIKSMARIPFGAKPMPALSNSQYRTSKFPGLLTQQLSIPSLPHTKWSWCFAYEEPWLMQDPQFQHLISVDAGVISDYSLTNNGNMKVFHRARIHHKYLRIVKAIPLDVFQDLWQVQAVWSDVGV